MPLASLGCTMCGGSPGVNKSLWINPGRFRQKQIGIGPGMHPSLKSTTVGIGCASCDMKVPKVGMAGLGQTPLDNTYGDFPIDYTPPFIDYTQGMSPSQIATFGRGVDGPYGGNGINWGGILNTGFNTGFSIAKDVFGIHPTLVQSNARTGQSTTYYAPQGTPASAINIPGFAQSTLSGGTIWIIAGVAIVALMAMGKGK